MKEAISHREKARAHQAQAHRQREDHQRDPEPECGVPEHAANRRVEQKL